MDLGLQDKVACVAGSSRGIGRAIAEALLREGARVAISGRTKEDLDRTLGEFRACWGPDRVLAIQSDLSCQEGADACIRAIETSWTGLDILIVNFGSGRGTVGWVVDQAEWNRLLGLNLTGSSLLAASAVPLMQTRGGGSIVFISSLAGVEALPAPLPYTSAKAGLIALSKALSRLLAPHHIRVNSVAPGNTLFPGGDWQRKLDEDPEGVTSYITKEVPLKRLGRVEEVADAVLFLASARASFITGACLVVDGGQAHGW